MPSLHAGFSLLIALYLGNIVGRRWVRVALLLYPLAMGFALVYSGEHYFLDVLMGWIYAVVVVVAVNRAADRLETWRQSRFDYPGKNSYYGGYEDGGLGEGTGHDPEGATGPVGHPAG
jgi:membrane-associated phospholipid phosphatase